MSPCPRATLTALLDEQRALETALCGLQPEPQQLLAVGDAVLQFAMHEEQILEMITTLLDPAAQTELAREHEEFAGDLDLLRWLLDTMPESLDVEVLTVSLARRIRHHIERDGRLLARAIALQTAE